MDTSNGLKTLVPNTIWSQVSIVYDKHALWGISHWGRKCEQFYGFTVNRESARDVYSRNKIIRIKKLTIVKWHNYKHLEWITVRIDDEKRYTFKEGDYNRLRLQDIEDMLLLLVQGKLTNLNIEERLALGVSLRMNQMEEYLPQTVWRNVDRERAGAMIQAIDRQLRNIRRRKDGEIGNNNAMEMELNWNKIQQGVSYEVSVSIEGVENEKKMIRRILKDGDEAYIVGNTLRYQDLEWSKALKNGKLKDEALKNKAIMVGIIDDDESHNEGWRRWEGYTKSMLLIEIDTMISTITIEDAAARTMKSFVGMTKGGWTSLEKKLTKLVKYRSLWIPMSCCSKVVFLKPQLLSASLLICLGKRDCVERIPSGGKLHDPQTKESWAILEDIALYDNESWNDPRDFAKPVKAITLPQDEDDGEVNVPSRALRDDDEPQYEGPNKVMMGGRSYEMMMNPKNENPNEVEGATIEEPVVEYFDTFPTRNELTYHRKLDPRENANGGISNFTGRIKGMHVFIGNFTYVVDFMIVEDISSILDPRLYLMRRSLEVLRKFHWMILGGRFNQLSHVSSPLVSKPGEY
ncbi:hypothetical protein Tco_1577372 [Tanacetum coccineum]